jgi:hypothetical protein
VPLPFWNIISFIGSLPALAAADDDGGLSTS